MDREESRQGTVACVMAVERRWAVLTLVASAAMVLFQSGPAAAQANAAPRANSTSTGSAVQSRIPSSGSSYMPVTPARVADTRCGESTQPSFCASEDLPAQNAGLRTLPPGGAIDVQVGGVDGVPSNATAAVMNVTAISSGPGYLTVYPAGSTRGALPSVVWPSGLTAVPNMVTVALGSGGQVSIYNHSGHSDVVVDVAGSYVPPASSTSTAGLFVPLTPARLADTRCASNPQPAFCASENLPLANSSLSAINPGGVVEVQVTGVGGAPSSGVAAVVLNVTAVTPTARTYLAVYPAGSTRAVVSNLNAAAGEVVTNRVTVRVGSGGGVAIYNNNGDTNVVVDITGYYTDGSSASQHGGLYDPLTPARLADTRCASNPQPGFCASENLPAQDAGLTALGPGATEAVTAQGVGGVPTSGVTAVDLNITVVDGSASGYLTAWPGGVARPVAADLNWTAGDVSSNATVAGTPGGKVDIYNHSGTVDVIVDVDGYFSPGPPTVTATSLPPGTVGVPYKALLAATGGVPPYRWSVASGALPAGLALDPSSGTIAGLPTQAVTATFSAAVVDSLGRSSSSRFSITIEALPPVSAPGPSGSLAVDVADVPPSTTPQVTVSGPGGYSVRLTGAGVLTGLAPGTYQVSAGPTQVPVPGNTYYASVYGSPVQVLAGQQSQAEVSWAEVPDTTAVLTQADAGYLQSEGNCTLSSGATGILLTFSAASPQTLPADITDLAPGQVVTAPPGPADPTGVFVLAGSVTSTGPSQIQVCGGPATLADAVHQGSFDAAETLGVTQVKGSLPPGITDPPGGFTGTFGPGDMDPTLSCGGSPPINVTGGLAFTPSFNMGASWSWTSGLTASVSGSVTEQLNLGVSAEAVAACNAKIPLLPDPILFDCYVVFVGPVPVSICPELQLYALVTVSGGVSQTISDSFTQTATVSAGLSVTCGLTGCSWSPQSSFTNSFTTTGPGTPEAGVAVKVAVGPELLFEVEELGGPTVNLDGFGELSISPTSQPWWQLSGGVEAGAGLSLNIGGEIPVASVSDPSIVSVSDVFAQAPSGPPPPPVPTASEPGLSPTSLPGATAGIPYSHTLGATGGAPPYTWSALSASLPPGLSLDPNSGQISGTPTREGTFTIPVTLSDQLASLPGHTLTENDTLVVSGPQITTTSLPDGEVGVAYHASLAATGGVCASNSSPPCVSWSATGLLPPGLSLDGATGQITGTPSSGSGSNPLTFTATDADGNTSQISLAIQLYPAVIIYANGLGLGSSVPPHGEAGVAYAGSLAVNSFTGDGPYHWGVTVGSLPPGLSLSCPAQPAGCPQVDLSGTPTSGDAGQTYSFTVQVTDSLGGTYTQSESVEVVKGVAITSGSLPGADTGIAYTAQVDASGGETPYTWAISGVAGLSISGTTSPATVSGTPPAPGAYTAQVTVTDELGGADSLGLPLTVNPLPVVTTTSLPDASIGQYYGQRVGESGGTAPLTWSLHSGTLPAGLRLDSSTGFISGLIEPDALDETFTLQVTDAWGQTASKTLGITVPLGLTTPAGPLQDGYAGVAYSTPCGGAGSTLVLGAAGGAPAYTWSVSSGALPAGLSLDSINGQVTGTPATPATFPSTSRFTITLEDQNGVKVSASYSITVYPDATVVSAVSPAVGGTIGGNQVTITGSGFCGPGISVSFGSTQAASLTVVSDTELQVTSPPGAAVQVQVQVTGYLGSSAPGPASAFTYYTTPVLSAARLLYGEVSEISCSEPSNTCQLDVGYDPRALELDFNVPVEATPGAPADFTLSGDSVVYKTLYFPAYPGVGQFPEPGPPLTCRLSGADSVAAFGTHLFIYAYSDPCLGMMAPPSGTISLTYSPAFPGGGYQDVYNTYPPVFSPAAALDVPAQQSDSLTCNASGFCSQTGGPFVIGSSFGGPAEVGVPVAWQAQGISPVPPDYWSVNGLPPGVSAGSPSYADEPFSGSDIESLLPITGKPTAAGTFNVSACIADGTESSCYGYSSSPTPLGSVVVTPAVSVSTATLPAATAGQAYHQILAAAGGVGFDTWSLVPGSGSLPPGLSLDPFTGTIGGVPSYPVCTGAYAPPACTYHFSVQVSDAYGMTASQALSISVGLAPMAVSTTSLPAAVAGNAYSATLQATGGLAPYQCSATGLPKDLSLDAATGQITGTPGSSDTAASPYTVQVTSKDAEGTTAQATLKLYVVAESVTITTTSLPAAEVGVPYSATIDATGGVTPYSWNFSTSPPPSGSGSGPASFGEGYLNLTPDNQSGTSATLAGTPSSIGKLEVTITVTDAAGETGSKTYTLVVNPQPLVVKTTSVQAGHTCAPYSATLTATGGVAPYTWALASGSSLPAGLSLDATGHLIGTPTASGSYSFSVVVTDSTGTQATDKISLTVDLTPLSLFPAGAPGGVSGTGYSLAADAAGGSCAYQWSVSADASAFSTAGLSLDTATGIISGTLGPAGTYDFTIQVTDSQGDTAHVPYSLIVTPAPSSTALAIDTTSLPVALAGAAYATTLEVTGGTGPYTWSCPTSGEEGCGLSFSGASLSASGQITGAPRAGTYPFTAKVTDHTGTSVTLSLTLYVESSPLVVTITSLSAGTACSPYTAALAASGGITPYAWSLASGTLPPGVTLDSSTGALSGTPTAAGSYPVTVEVTDQASQTATADLTVTVDPDGALTITTSSLPKAYVGQTYPGLTLQAGGGACPYTSWAVTSGALPAGLTLDSATGSVSGYIDASDSAGTYTFTVTVTDSKGDTADKQLSITVGSFSGSKG